MAVDVLVSGLSNYNPLKFCYYTFLFTVGRRKNPIPKFYQIIDFLLQCLLDYFNSLRVFDIPDFLLCTAGRRLLQVNILRAGYVANLLSSIFHYLPHMLA